MKTIFILALSCMIPLFADVSQGESLERQMWEDMKHRNFTAVEEKIAPEFQSVHSDGTRNKTEELKLIKDLNLGSYRISDIKVTGDDNSYVVSYLISVGETIDDTRLSSQPAPRLSVWEKINGKWQWVAHANLNPIKKESK